MALIIKDGVGSTTSLKTTLTGSDHMPHHIVQAVSGTVNVSASAAYPVYVTGNVSVNQPINVDVDISDKLTVVVSSSANNNAVWVTSSNSYPVFVKNIESSVVTASISGTPTVTLSSNAVTASISGTPTVTVGNAGLNTLISNLNSAYTTVGTASVLVQITGSNVSALPNNFSAVYVKTTQSVVTIDNTAADPAFTALSYSFADNSLKVKLTGSNTIKEGPYDILLVKGTGSETTIINTGFQQAINHITAATDLGDSDFRFKVITTGSSAVTINNAAADTAFTALSYSFADNSLKVKLTGSNTIGENGYDILWVRTTGSTATIDNTGFQQAINFLTASYDFGGNISKFNVQLTGNSEVTVNHVGFQQAINYITSAYNSGDNVGKFNVQLTGNSAVTIDNQFFNDAVTAISYSYAAVDGGTLKVKLTGSNTVKIDSYDTILTKITSSIVEVTNSLNTPLFITSSYDLVIKQKQAKSSTVTGIYYPGQFSWSTNSGTFVLAAEEENRKGLIISNPSSERLYVVVGSGSNNGFTLSSTGSAPTVFSFIIFASGTYVAEPTMAGAFHAGFFVSQSNFTEIPYAMATKVVY
jgi:hypothetical protein